MDLDKSFDLELCFESIDGSPTLGSTSAKDATIKVSPMKRSAAKPPLPCNPKRSKIPQKISYAMCPRVSPIVFVDGTNLERIMKEPLHRLTPTNGDFFQPINEDDKEFMTTLFDQLD